MILLGVHIPPSLDFYNDSTLENKTLLINTQNAALAKIYFCILFVNVCVLRISSYFFFLLAASGLSCRHRGSLLNHWDLSGWRTDSLVAAQGLSSYGTQTYILQHAGIWDLSSPTMDGTGVPCIARQILNHQTTREVPSHLIFEALTRC